MPFFQNYLIYIWNRVLVISLDGWRIGQRDLPRSSPCLFSTASTNLHLDRKRQFLYEFSVKKLVFWGFRGYLGEIEFEKKRLEFFIYVFFSHSQWCVRISASNFCSPICIGSRDTTLGSFLRFMAGFARTSPRCTIHKTGCDLFRQQYYGKFGDIQIHEVCVVSSRVRTHDTG